MNSKKSINVGFIGNPNCGKTTLFNAFTGANLKVANWPGVTVEKKEGTTYYQGQEFRLIDLPGMYYGEDGQQDPVCGADLPKINASREPHENQPPF